MGKDSEQDTLTFQREVPGSIPFYFRILEIYTFYKLARLMGGFGRGWFYWQRQTAKSLTSGALVRCNR